MLDLVQMEARGRKLRFDTALAMAVRSVCVQCGSGPGFDATDRAAADQLGRGLARTGIGLFYRGLPTGLLEVIVAAVLSEGGQVTGIVSATQTDRLPVLRSGHRLIVVHDGETSARVTYDAVDAFVAFPGSAETSAAVVDRIDIPSDQPLAKPVITIDPGAGGRPVVDPVDPTVRSGFSRRGRAHEVCANVDDALMMLNGIAVPPSRHRIGRSEVDDGRGLAPMGMSDDQPSDEGFDDYDIH